MKSLSLSVLLAISLPLSAATTYDITQLGLIDAENTDIYGRQQNFAELLSASGYVAGSSYRYSGAGAAGMSAWLYNGDTNLNVGLTGVNHTRSDGYKNSRVKFLNNQGHAAGYSARYNGSATAGQSIWVHQNGVTQEIGLRAAINTLPDGSQYNQIQGMNNASQVIGHAQSMTGEMAWIYNNESTSRIGLVGTQHTSRTGLQNSRTEFLNQSGFVVGYSNRYVDLPYADVNAGRSSWIYNGTDSVEIGLTDAEHTRAIGLEQYNYVVSLNEAGHVAGHTNRYNERTQVGQSAWVFNGVSSVKIGMTNVEHTQSSNGSQSNTIIRFNESSQAVGYAHRYNDDTYNGTSAWYYNGIETIKLGLVDANHTRDDGHQYNMVKFLNDAGDVVGQSTIYDGNSTNGQSAWAYNGNTVRQIGLVDAEHTRTYSDGYQYHNATLQNESGHIAGTSSRYSSVTNGNVTSYASGISAWFDNGTESVEIGLIDADHTREDNGVRVNTATHINENGQVAGTANRYNSPSGLGKTAWLYDSALDQTFSLTFSEHTDGYVSSDVSYLGDDGTVFGRYKLYDEADIFLSDHAYVFTIDDGFFDLGSLLTATLDEEGWRRLYDVNFANEEGFVVGSGALSQGGSPYLLTPQLTTVPLPASVWLFLSGLLGFIVVSRSGRKKISFE